MGPNLRRHIQSIFIDPGMNERWSHDISSHQCRSSVSTFHEVPDLFLLVNYYDGMTSWCADLQVVALTDAFWAVGLCAQGCRGNGEGASSLDKKDSC